MKYVISVIVTCYNVRKYLRKTLDSLVNQSIFDKLCIICIDDGSSDDTLAILYEYAKKYQNFTVHTQTNQGIAKVRNKGLELVETKYFTFLDGDDYLEENIYERLYDAIEKEQAQMSVCNFVWDFEENKKKNYIFKEGPYDIGKDTILNIFATLWNKMYLTSFVKEMDFKFPDGYRYEDASFLYKLAFHLKKIAFVDEALIYYVQRKESITHTNNEKVKDMVFVFKDLYNYCKKNNFYDLYKDEIEYVFIRFFLGNTFLKAVKIKDVDDRKKTLELNWSLLNDTFPNWKRNKYLKKLSIKNIYYRLINKHNYSLIARMFVLLKR